MKLAELLELLTPLASPEIDYLTVNGFYIECAPTDRNTYGLYPEESVAGVEILFHGGSSWLSGGPCVMEQHEQIHRFGDLYWVINSGDMEYKVVVVGRHSEMKDGVGAAVAASTYFSIDAEGNIHSELDDGPQEQ